MNLSRAFGDFQFKNNPFIGADKQAVTADPDVFVVDLDDHIDFVIVGCDGVYETMNNQEIVEWVYERIGRN